MTLAERLSGLHPPAPKYGAERRRSERTPFSAVALVVEGRSGARITARVADVSPEGCYVDSLNTFEVGTAVMVSIRHGGMEIKAMASVRYALQSMGMGLQFSDPSLETLSILHKWIAEARGETIPSLPAVSSAPRVEPSMSAERLVVYHLLEILTNKRLLTEAESAELIRELLRSDYREVATKQL